MMVGSELVVGQVFEAACSPDAVSSGAQKLNELGQNLLNLGSVYRPRPVHDDNVQGTVLQTIKTCAPCVHFRTTSSRFSAFL
jgi:hypothetical protein